MPADADAATIRELPFALPSPRTGTIHGDVRFAANGPDARPVVLFAHGFKGFKDWGPRPAFGRFLAEQGFVSVLFNFSHNGVTPAAPTEITDLEAFAANTYTRELDDLEAVTDAVAAGGLGDAPLDPDRLGLVGHSRGGGIATLRAERDARVRALVTWAAVGGFVERFTDEQVRAWFAQGYATVTNSRTGQTLRLGRALYDDALAHERVLDVQGAAAKIDVPWLVVHAPDDDAVAFAEGEALAAACDHAELMRAEGGHTFGGRHPHPDGADVPASLQAVWMQTTAFLAEHLR